MELTEYQQQAVTTAIFPEEFAVMYLTLGLTGEAGEVAEKVKKIIRDSGGDITEDDISTLKKELGDVLWYLSVFADRLGITLDEVAATNLAKLKSRQQRDVLKGSGDDR